MGHFSYTSDKLTTDWTASASVALVYQFPMWMRCCVF